MRNPGERVLERVNDITVIRLPPLRRRGGISSYIFEYVAFTILSTLTLAVRGLRRPYQLVEVNNLPDWLVIAAALPKLRGAKITFYCREDTGRLLAADRSLSLRHPAVRFLSFVNRTCARMADGIIVTQELGRRDFVDKGIPAEKVLGIANSCDEHAFFVKLPSGPMSFELPPPEVGTFRLVTHGTLVRRYGIETLLRAMASLLTDIPNIHLDILGDGSYRGRLESLTDELGLRPHVTFTGWLPRYEQVAPRLAMAHVGVNPIWTDFQLCNKLVDYLALGMPAISTDCEALIPYLDDSEVSFVPPRDVQALADAIAKLYRDEKYRFRLAAAGHAAYLRHFAWERAKPDYVALYQNGANHHSEPVERDANQTADIEHISQDLVSTRS